MRSLKTSLQCSICSKDLLRGERWIQTGYRREAGKPDQKVYGHTKCVRPSMAKILSDEKSAVTSVLCLQQK